MSKFKVGDRVRVKDDHLRIGVTGVADGWTDKGSFTGREGYISSVNRNGVSYDVHPKGVYGVVDYGGYYGAYPEGALELVSETTKRKGTMRKLYRLKKDSLEHKKGLVVMENCTDGTQDFTEVLQPHHPEHYTPVSVKRELVEKKGWWEEVRMNFTPVNGNPKNGKRVRAYQDKIEGEVEKTTPTHYLFRTPDGKLHRRLKKSCKEV